MVRDAPILLICGGTRITGTYPHPNLSSRDTFKREIGYIYVSPTHGTYQSVDHGLPLPPFGSTRFAREARSEKVVSLCDERTLTALIYITASSVLAGLFQGGMARGDSDNQKCDVPRSASFHPPLACRD